MSRLACLTLAASAAALAVSLTAPEARADDGQKSGPWMVNLKLGGGFFTNTGGAKEFVIELDAGRAVVGNSGYVVFSPHFSFGDYTVVTIPVGFQWDFEMPVKNLYVYPRAVLGYSYLHVEGATVHSFSLAPAIGVKYVLAGGRVNVGLEPFNMPILFGEGGPFPEYRFNGYAGVNF